MGRGTDGPCALRDARVRYRSGPDGQRAFLSDKEAAKGPGCSVAEVRRRSLRATPVLLFVALPCFFRRLSPPAGFCVRQAVGANGRTTLRSCGGRCLECFFRRPNGRAPDDCR